MITENRVLAAKNGVLAAQDPVEALQAAMLQLPQFEPVTRHVFNHGGLYRREMDMPAGSTVVGMVHRKDHFLFVCKGVVAITDGSEPARQFMAGDLITSFAGTKRALHALTDATLTTIHASKTTTVQGADRLVEPDDNSPFLPGNRLPLKEIAQ